MPLPLPLIPPVMPTAPSHRPCNRSYDLDYVLPVVTSQSPPKAVDLAQVRPGCLVVCRCRSSFAAVPLPLQFA